MRDVPVWAFHGAKDPAVPYTESERLVQRLKELDADAKFTLYPDTGHDSWTKAYQDPELYKWLLSKSKVQKSPVIAEKVLLSYVGRYKYSEQEQMDVTYDGKNLYVESSVAKRKIVMKPLTSTKFRLPGPLTGDGDMYFDVTQEGKIAGFTVGPCDHTYCPRIN
jgi:hypothetical protein